MLSRRRSFSLLLSLALLVSPLRAQPGDDARRAQIATASANAMEKLRDDVRAARITPKLTVEQFLKQTDSTEQFEQTLQRAQQIGGPRWIDEETCQIQLEISGGSVSAALVEIASAKPDVTPIHPDVLARETRSWRDRSFSGMGASVSPQRVNVLRPVRARAWDRIGDDVRKQAVAAARQDAMRRALESVRPLEIAPGVTVAQALADPEVSKRINSWYDSRPIKNVSFSENLQVELTLGAPPDAAFDEFLAAAGADVAPEVRDRLREQFVQRMAEPSGRASVSRAAVDMAVPLREAVDVPPQPPDWISRQLDAEGTVKGRESRLQAVHAAQRDATDHLRAKLAALRLNEDLTLGEAAKRDTKIAQALDRAMVRARVFKVDYAAEGGVTVRVTIDARDVWDEILNAR